MHLFESLDAIVDLPYPAFTKKLLQLEKDWQHIDISEIEEDSLDEYFSRLKDEYSAHTGERAKTRLATISYLSHFDTLVEKYFPDYVAIFQASFDRPDALENAPLLLEFLEHMKEILRDYTHRLSEPDNYPSYTNFIQEIIQNSMIDCFFWLQDREATREREVTAQDRNTDLHIVLAADTSDPLLRCIRASLEILGEGVLEKIFYNLEYVIKTSPTHPDLELLGRYEKAIPTTTRI